MAARINPSPILDVPHSGRPHTRTSVVGGERRGLNSNSQIIYDLVREASVASLKPELFQKAFGLMEATEAARTRGYLVGVVVQELGSGNGGVNGVSGNGRVSSRCWTNTQNLQSAASGYPAS